MSDDEANIPAEEPAQPILLPEHPFAAACEPIASPWERVVRSRRPRVWTVWFAFVVSQVVNIAAVIVLLLLLTVWEHGPTALSSPRVGQAVLEVSQGVLGLLSTVCATMIVFFSTAVTAAALSPVHWRERLRLRPAGISAFGFRRMIWRCCCRQVAPNTWSFFGWLLN